MTPIYPAHCEPCLAKRECQSLPHSINCEKLRRVEPIKPDADNEMRTTARNLP